MTTTDDRAFEEISETLRGPLSGYLQKMVGNAADAEDLLQDALIRIHKGLPDLKENDKVKSWAYRVATNVAIDALRKGKKVQIVEFDESSEPDDFDMTDKPVLDEMTTCIRDVIDGLPPDYRSALVLHGIQDLSIAETVRICEVSIGATKVRIHRARLRLKEALNDGCNFYESNEGNLRCEGKPEKC